MEQQQQSNKAHRGGTKKPGAKKKLHQDGQNKRLLPYQHQENWNVWPEDPMMSMKNYMYQWLTVPDDDPPPVIIAVVGPPGTGKSTLIKSLIRRLTKTTLTEINGPITVVSGKEDD